jgi:hypothetical protein
MIVVSKNLQAGFWQSWMIPVASGSVFYLRETG